VEYHGIAHRLDDGGLRVIDGWYADRESAVQQAAALTRDYLILTAVITVREPWPLVAWRTPVAAHYPAT
jgi:hypothetical protein